MTERPVATERDSPPDAPGYHAYMLRLWCDGEEAGWHASLQAPGAPERRGFADLESLMEYLHHLCPPSDPSVQPTTTSQFLQRPTNTTETTIEREGIPNQ